MTNPKAKVETFTFVVDKKLECVIRDPDFEQLSMALTELRTKGGRLNMAGAGKMIFDLCKVSCDKKIEASPRFMVSLCLEIAGEFMESVQVDLKKN